jgi:hypothetical protein
VPFEFTTDNWGAYSFNGDDIAAGDRWQRTVRIQAASVLGLDSPSDDWIWRLRSLTHDKDVTLFGDHGSYSRRPYLVAIGPEAQATYATALANDLQWPFYWSAKALRHYSLSPFDPAWASFFARDLDVPRMISTLTGARLAPARAALVRIQRGVESRTDFFGHAGEFVPRVKLDVLIDQFERQWTGFERLAMLIIESAATPGPTDDETAQYRRALVADLTTTKNTLPSVQDDLGKAASKMAVLAQERASKHRELETFKLNLQQWAKERREKEESAARLQVAADAIGLAGTVAVSVFATPAAGAVFAKSWATAGGVVVDHQRGRSVRDLASATAAVRRGTDKGAQWASSAEALITDWRALEKSGAEGKTVEEQAKLAYSVLTKVKELYDATAAQGTVNLDQDLLNWDPAWKSEANRLTTEFEALNGSIAATEADVAQSAQRLQDALQRVMDLGLAIESANEADPRNDYELAQRKSLYLSLLSRMFSGLATRTAEIVRAHAYLTGLPLSLPDDLANAGASSEIERGLVAAIDEQGADGDRNGAELARYAAMVKDLRVKYLGFIQLVRSQIEDAQRRRLARPLLEETWAFSATDRDPSKMALVVALNAELKHQFRDIVRTRGQVATVVAPGIPIPGDAFLGPPVVRFEQLSEIFVEDVQFVGVPPPDAKLEITINHPAYGEVWRRDACQLASFYDANAEENVLQFPAVLTPGGKLTYAGIAQDVYAEFPLRTNYFLTTRLLRQRADNDVTDWRTPPAIKSLRMKVRYRR